VEGSGKTTLTLSIASQVQKMGGLVGIIDAEHALDPEYAKKIGVNVDELFVSQPEYGEQGLEIGCKMIESGALSLLIVDSVAALVPKAEVEGQIEDANMALQARMMGRAMRKMKTMASLKRCTVIFINQLREKPGVSFGNPTYTPGGKALKFFADIRLEISRGEAIKNGDEQIGNRPTAKAVKNKVAPPFRKAMFTLIFGQGIDNTADLLRLGVEKGIVEKTGSWYAHGGNRIGQGEDQAKKWLKDNVSVMDQIEAALKNVDNKASAALPAAPEKK
jgi:recombination protein RecA